MEPPPSSLIGTGDVDADAITSMLSNVPTLLADNCLLELNLIGDGGLDGTTTISDTPGGGDSEHVSSTLAYTCGVGDGVLDPM